MAKFKVGDKVRVVSVLPNAYHNGYKVGDVYNVEDTYSCGVIVKGANRPDLRLLFVEIELVKEDANMSKYRTEKRKARVGERILITNAETTFGVYSNGDVLTVKSMYDDGVSQGVEIAENESAPYIFHREYVVIVEDAKSAAFKKGDRVIVEKGPYCLTKRQRTGAVIGKASSTDRGDYLVKLDNYSGTSLSFLPHEMTLIEETLSLAARVTELEAEVETLKAQLGAKPDKDAQDFAKALAFEMTRGNVRLAKQTPNSRRATVIKQAREFVADLEKRAVDNTPRYDGNELLRTFRTKLTFQVNAEKGVVTALAHANGSGTLGGKAFAKCAPGDVFNADIGKAIAAGRLYGVKIPQEFYNAPKPTEVVVGMRVDNTFSHAKQFGWGIGKVTEIESPCGLRGYWVEGNSYSFLDSAVIIDDTAAQY